MATLTTTTITGDLTITGTTTGIAAGTDWQSVKTSNFTAVAGEGYFVNTTSSAITATLPSSPSAGDTVIFKDYAGTFSTNNLTIARNGSNIQGFAIDSVIDADRSSVELVYIDATKGWLYTNEANPPVFGNTFIAATGGTVTTSGDYKIHTFTGDGSFVVSTAPAGAAPGVDYLVVAGGGAGGESRAGGGGGGGYRESAPGGGEWTASPIANTSGTITASVTTYPVTVGGGGAAQPHPTKGQPGSNSVFSTITSAGGGGGSTDQWPNFPSGFGLNGGSGGGSTNGAAGGSGNTPPVSPPQGQGGGGSTESSPGFGAGGGGGAAQAGQSGTTSGGGNGGNGGQTSISTSSTYYAGGGGGGSYGGTAGSGGLGGGGDGRGGPPGTTAQPGTANTGGGGGGSNQNAPSGTNGGSGIVILRYKYQ